MLNVQKVIQSVLLASLALGTAVANAKTVYLDKAPSSTVSASAAQKHMSINGQLAWKCESVMTGPNINPVKVPGSDATWVTAESVGEPIENPFIQLSEGKPTWRCKTMRADLATGRVRTAK